MIIREISIGSLQIPLIKPFKTALRTVYTLDVILVKITTDNGIIGYGETAPTVAITGESKESIIKAINYIKPLLIDKSIADFDTILDTLHSCIVQNFSAKSAIEIALYDIAAQNAKLPLYKYLGGDKTYFQTGITISLNDTDTMVKDSLEAIQDGFGSLKIKLGFDYREDIDRVSQIYSAVGNNISLKLDANQGWSPEESVKFLNAIEKISIPISFIEQPVDRYDIEGLKYIKQRTSIPILADESIFSPNDARKLLEEEAVDLINIKLDKCGGISKALEIADICKDYDVECMVGCMLEGAISVGAATHVASARSDTITMYDLDAPMLCSSAPVIGGARFDAPRITLSENHGLGIKDITGIIWI